MLLGKKPTVLISGCSTGIGEASAKLLAEKGWIVFAGVRKQEDAQKLRGYSDNIKPLILDVTKEDEIRDAVEQVRVAVGEDGLDGLVNNAGVGYSGPIEFISMNDVTAQFDINVFGLIRLTQAAMPLIRMGTPGRIVNLGSLATDQPGPYVGVYDGTKAAVEAITYTFRLEVARWGIKVILVKPGPVDSQFAETAFKIQDAYMKHVVPGTACHQYYGRDLENFKRNTEPFKKYLVQPTASAERVYEALTDKHPKNVTYDTWTSAIMKVVLNWMPQRLYDKAISDAFIGK